MQINRLKANHLSEPIGADLSSLSLSWVVETETPAELKKQFLTRVVIATNPTFRNPVFDSDARDDIDPISFEPGVKLEPRTRYYWQVELKSAAKITVVSEKSFFETGKMSEPWAAKWITQGFAKEPTHRFIARKKITLADDPARSANTSFRIHATALGVYEIKVNGRKITDEVLLPGYHSYWKHVQAQTFDIAPFLQRGDNSITIHVGEGWYNSSMGWGNSGQFGPHSGVIAEVRGAKGALLAATDATWETSPSPVIKSSIYFGENYDANLEVPARWTGAVEFAPEPEEAGPIVDRLSPPIRVIETLKPKVIKTPKGETVLDFGQNFTGWLTFNAPANWTTTMRIQVGELLQEGNFYRDNLRAAEAQYTYKPDGKKRVVRPHFTFYGFRYAKLEGFPKTMKAADFKGLVIHSDLERTGFITTDNKKVNQLISNALWGQKGNFLDVPTDCPQRDERLGWTGDAQIFAGTACFQMDCSAFFTKYMRDVVLEQPEFGGGIGHTVPALTQWIRSAREGGADHSKCAWGDACTVVPMTAYEYYGDKAALRKAYPAMKAWVGYIKGVDERTGGKRIWADSSHFGDWLALDDYKGLMKDSNHVLGMTDQYFICTAYYARSTELTRDAALVLGETKDAARYTKLLAEVKAAFLAEFFTATGRCVCDTQTAHALALHFNLVPEKFRARTFDRLVKLLEDNKWALTTGFVGTPILCRVLSDNGRPDIAMKLLLREDYPSWLYEVNLGATTVWERWNSVLPDGTCSGTGMNSMNHYAYGSIVEWMYRNLAGLRPAAPGFRKALIAPD
ncbi:MAG: family 78 glycoside hydrolase catalytic domain, partial [Kiritimatiellaeota bacterium]|nr:family 78 glycoside hydrolase catalytic domain [Kiritimatiellota bacterium]